MSQAGTPVATLGLAPLSFSLEKQLPVYLRKYITNSVLT